MKLGKRLTVGEVVDLTPATEPCLEAPATPEDPPARVHAPAEPVVAHAVR